MRRPWTDAELDTLREFVRAHAPRTMKDWEPCATALQRTVNGCRLQADEKGYKSAPVPIGVIPPKVSQLANNDAKMSQSANNDTLEPPVAPALHVKKLHVHVPPAVEPTPSPLLRAVIYGDTHLPFQDDAALRVVGQIIRMVSPDVVCHDGDLLDAYHLSRFDTNPKRLHRLQDEIDAARAHLAAFRLLAPKARFVFLEGNHEDRLRRAMWSMPPHAKALMALDAVTEALTWPKLLGLDDLDIEFYAYGEQSKAKILPKWILKHGSVVRKLSAYTARAEWEKYGKSGSSGHTHRLGMFMHRDHNGSHCWVETGCTCTLTPEYTEDPDWMHGCLVLTFEPQTGAFQAEPVYIHQGTTVFRGQWIDARSV